MPTRAVFLVHGVGSQKKGEFLRDVLNPLLRYLDANFRNKQDESIVERSVELRPEHGPAWAEVQFGDEHWEIWECHWADAFHTLNAPQVLLWGWRAGILNLGNFLAGALPFLRGGPAVPSPRNDSVYPRSQSVPWHVRFRAFVYDLIVGLALSAALVIAYVPVLLLASLFYVVAILPDWLLFPNLLRRAVVGLVEYIVEGFGDQYTMMYTRASMGSIKGQLMSLMEPYFNQAYVGQRRECDSAVVIAHSGGATLSFAMLSDPDLWRRWTGVDQPPQRICFFSVGSSLNIASESVPDHPMWDHPLPENVAWVDVWARYDPVPHGPASEWLVERVRRRRGYYRSLRVTNYDNLFADHGAYWGNHEEVVSRFLYETCRTDDVSLPAADIQKVVQESVDLIPRHRSRIAGKTTVVLSAAAAVLALGTVSGLIEEVGRQTLALVQGGAGWTGVSENLLDILRSQGPDWLRFAAGATVIGAAFFVPWQVYSVQSGPRSSRHRAALGLVAFALLLLVGGIIVFLQLTNGGVVAIGQGIESALARLMLLPEYPLGLVIVFAGFYALWTFVHLWVVSPYFYQDPWAKKKGKP